MNRHAKYGLAPPYPRIPLVAVQRTLEDRSTHRRTRGRRCQCNRRGVHNTSAIVTTNVSTRPLVHYSVVECQHVRTTSRPDRRRCSSRVTAVLSARRTPLRASKDYRHLARRLRGTLRLSFAISKPFLATPDGKRQVAGESWLAGSLTLPTELPLDELLRKGQLALPIELAITHSCL